MSRTGQQIDPMETGWLHRALVLSNDMQRLPDRMILLTIGLNLLLVVVSWPGDLTVLLVVSLAFVITVGVDWVLLRALPRTGRSYGPDKPATLALAAVQALLLIALGLLAAPWWLALFLMLVQTFLVYYATWIEPFRLGVTHQRYATPHWPADKPPLRLLHIGDLHIERITARERRLNALIEDLQPEVIVFSGDFVNLSHTHDPEAEKAIREIISAWSAPYGVYCVPGTPLVEPLERVRAFVDGLDNLRLLENGWISFETAAGTLNILGLVTTHQLDIDRAAFKKMMTLAPPSGLRLLLTHAPDIAPEADAAGLDLYLCGHTHGGQIRLPLIGALLSSSQLGKRFIMGRYHLADLTLYTTRGVGMEGLGAPRARFLCPPEIVLWEIGGTGS